MSGPRFRLSELIRETRALQSVAGSFLDPGTIWVLERFNSQLESIWGAREAEIRVELAPLRTRPNEGAHEAGNRQGGRNLYAVIAKRGMLSRWGRAGVDRDGNWRSPGWLPREQSCTTVAMKILASQCGGWNWGMTIPQAATFMRRFSEIPNGRRSLARFLSRGCQVTLFHQ